MDINSAMVIQLGDEYLSFGYFMNDCYYLIPNVKFNISFYHFFYEITQSIKVIKRPHVM